MAVQPPCYQFPVQLAFNALNSFYLWDLLDDAFANLFCLHTYTHGTSPRNNYSIVAHGADPRLGGREDMGEGSFHHALHRERGNSEAWNSQGKFYVMTDDIHVHISGINAVDVPLARFLKKATPRGYSTICTAGEMTPNEATTFQGITAIVSGIFLSTFSPTLKFRFLPEDAEGRFQRDPTHGEGNIASFTQQPISSDHIGLYGTFAHAFSGNLLGRIQNDPWRFAEGVVEVILVVALAVFAASTLATSSAATTAITILLTYETAVAVGRFVVPLLFGLLAQQPTDELPARA